MRVTYSAQPDTRRSHCRQVRGHRAIPVAGKSCDMTDRVYAVVSCFVCAKCSSFFTVIKLESNGDLMDGNDFLQKSNSRQAQANQWYAPTHVPTVAVGRSSCEICVLCKEVPIALVRNKRELFLFSFGHGRCINYAAGALLTTEAYLLCGPIVAVVHVAVRSFCLPVLSARKIGALRIACRICRSDFRQPH